jgi:hypothetical protein
MIRVLMNQDQFLGEENVCEIKAPLDTSPCGIFTRLAGENYLWVQNR